ncbi:host specificity factor TipJ family phage tail protein [Microvirga sp. GCM10011540]|uniref:host specificity factor TipJ family phage tail protein n=1 Tax=Microvirga sp. GCM10011540 TaxID=3317338 RepID=UPI003618596A
MTLILHRSDVGEDLREPQTLVPRRRRLSTLATRRLPGRPCIVSVHRAGALLQPTDETVRLRKAWKNTLVGPHDTVVITYLPLGGASGGSGGGGGKAIGAAVAMIALAVAAPYIAGPLAAGLGLGATGTAIASKVIALGIVAGGAYFLSKATQAKANKDEDTRPVYGVSGGGNLPRPGDRIPVNYGRIWHQPDLSQADYFVYTGGTDSDQILFKRLTLGAGRYKVHSIRVGQALMWTEQDGLVAPFTNAEIEFIAPGAASGLVPGAVYSSQNVAGTELPRADDVMPWMGPFPVTEPGVVTSRIQLDWSYPQGHFMTHPRQTQKLPAPWGVVFEYAAIDEDGRVVGGWMPLYNDNGNSVATRAVRTTRLVDVPPGRYAVRGRAAHGKLAPELEEAGVTYTGAVHWDGLRSHLFNEPLRPDVSEIAMKISAEAMGSTMAFSDIWVETTSILPVRIGETWVEEPTRKAVWIALDVLRNQTYGGAYPDGKIDLATFGHYASTLTEHDTFDGAIRGPVSVYEAAATVLGVIRAEPILIGDTWSMVRDEPRAYQKHVISRRQIVKDTTGAEFDLDMSNGMSDVIVEYFVDGDTRRRAEVRATIGAETITPRRIQAFGVSSHEHATMLARWYAASAYYRREARTLTTELAGRILGRNDPAMIEAWFMDGTLAAGVTAQAGLSLTLDVDFTLPAGAHAVLRDQHGQEWGPVAITGHTDRTITLDSGDVAVIEGYTGRTLASLFGKPNRRLPVTILLGTLAELSKPYIIRSARPEGEGRVQVTAVYDAPEVWQVLGEAIPPAPPIKVVVDDEGQLTPILPWVRAHVLQKATAIVLEWSVAVARGCRLYRVDIAYGDEQWQNIHAGEATSGSYVVEYRDEVDLRIRAVAINALGVPSAPVYTTAALFKPIIDGDIADFLVEFDNLVEQLQYEIGLISDIGQGTIDEMRREVFELSERIANAAATQAGHSYQQLDLVKVTLTENVTRAFAAIERETEVRVSELEAVARILETLAVRLNDAEAQITEERTARVDADEALADVTDRLQARLTTAETNITAEGTARQSLTTRVTTAEGKIETLNTSYTGLNSRMKNAEGDISGQATLVNQLTTRVTNVEGVNSSQAQSIQALGTQLNGQSATLTQYAQSVDGIKVQWGVVGTINGQTGGFLFQGVRRLDGAVLYSLNISGDVLVSGTIRARHLAAETIIASSAQIGNLVVDNLNIANGAVSNSSGSQGDASASVSLQVRSGARVAVFATYYGSPGTPRPIGSSGIMTVQRHYGSGASVLRSITNNHWINQTSASVFFLSTTVFLVDTPPAGLVGYSVSNTYGGGVAIVAIELSK